MKAAGGSGSNHTLFDARNFPLLSPGSAPDMFLQQTSWTDETSFSFSWLPSKQWLFWRKTPLEWRQNSWEWKPPPSPLSSLYSCSPLSHSLLGFWSSCCQAAKYPPATWPAHLRSRGRASATLHPGCDVRAWRKCWSLPEIGITIQRAPLPEPTAESWDHYFNHRMT